ncbi:hypothetical protein PA598K_02806 [Paenibacillus sp. 598K]|uniref:hypothetical protein n=1 Tax=Paenibacillus sp. 598K TaxID=1117987 RepID=UPI000FFA09C7|nr:hypothetical protein [Paenibacillus sp. 598K]GBF74461.1 hypothetical protein PA598K_02806 [Paenibacillus sp. 598K]
MQRNKMQNKRAIGFALIFLCLCLGCANTNIKPNTDLSIPGPENLEEMVLESDIIVIVNLTGVEEVEKEGKQKAKLMDVEVTDVIRGEAILERSIITIDTLQRLSAWNDPKQRRFLLFLKPSSQKSDGQAVYVITGGVMGILMVDDQGLLFYTTVEPLYPNSKKFYMDEAFTGLTIEEAREKINEILDGK